MENRKIAMDAYELRQQKLTLKAKKIFYFCIIFNILLAIPVLFEPGQLVRGILTLSVAAVLSLLGFLGVKYVGYLWAAFSIIQLGYYFFHVGVYVSIAYPLSWLLLVCARSVFCIYSTWAIFINYDVQDIIFLQRKKFFKEK